MADPTTRILAELNSSWEAGVIAKPTFYERRDQTFRPANAIGCSHGDRPQYDAAPGDTEHYSVWDFQLYIIGTTDANRELLIEQTLKHIRACQNASFKWKVARPHSFVKTGDFTCFIDGREESIVAVSAW